jgi:hypothetical protein
LLWAGYQGGLPIFLRIPAVFNDENFW